MRIHCFIAFLLQSLIIPIAFGSDCPEWSGYPMYGDRTLDLGTYGTLSIGGYRQSSMKQTTGERRAILTDLDGKATCFHQWEPQVDVPSERYNASLFLIGQKAVAYGGIATRGRFGDALAPGGSIYDVTTKQWTKMSSLGEPPLPHSWRIREARYPEADFTYDADGTHMRVCFRDTAEEKTSCRLFNPQENSWADVAIAKEYSEQHYDGHTIPAVGLGSFSHKFVSPTIEHLQYIKFVFYINSRSSTLNGGLPDVTFTLIAPDGASTEMTIRDYDTSWISAPALEKQLLESTVSGTWTFHARCSNCRGELNIGFLKLKLLGY